jgi:hypothetical protein
MITYVNAVKQNLLQQLKRLSFSFMPVFLVLREKARQRGQECQGLLVVLIPLYARRLIGYTPTPWRGLIGRRADQSGFQP